MRTYKIPLLDKGSLPHNEAKDRATGICRDGDKIVTQLEDSRTESTKLESTYLCKQARVWSTGAAGGTFSSYVKLNTY